MVSYPCGPPSSLDTEVRHAALVQTWWPLTPSVAQVSEIGNGLAAPAFTEPDGFAAQSAMSLDRSGVRPQGSVQIDVHARVRATTAASTSDNETGAWATATGSVLPRSADRSASGCRHSAGSSGETAHSDVRQPAWRGLSVMRAVMADLSSRNGWGVDPLRH